MEVCERINQLLEKKKISKREFAKKLRDLEPKLNSTGEIPSEKTIYKYLNGTISIKIELIPFIAEVLQVTEQDLFTNDDKSRRKFFFNLLKTASDEELNIIKTKLNYHSVYNEKDIVRNKDKEISELISLLEYAPKPLIKNLIFKLKEIKEFSDAI